MEGHDLAFNDARYSFQSTEAEHDETQPENVCVSSVRRGKNARFPGIHMDPTNRKKKWRSQIRIGGIEYRIKRFVCVKILLKFAEI